MKSLWATLISIKSVLPIYEYPYYGILISSYAVIQTIFQYFSSLARFIKIHFKSHCERDYFPDFFWLNLSLFYRISNDFCQHQFCIMIFLNAFIRCVHFLVDSFMCRIISSTSKDTLNFFFPIFTHYISFIFLIHLAKSSSTKLDRNRDNDLKSSADFRENTWNLSLYGMMLAVSLLYIALLYRNM